VTTLRSNSLHRNQKMHRCPRVSTREFSFDFNRIALLSASTGALGGFYLANTSGALIAPSSSSARSAAAWASEAAASARL
jgi:hypothetical protein